METWIFWSFKWFLIFLHFFHLQPEGDLLWYRRLHVCQQLLALVLTHSLPALYNPRSELCAESSNPGMNVWASLPSVVNLWVFVSSRVVRSYKMPITSSKRWQTSAPPPSSCSTARPPATWHRASGTTRRECCRRPWTRCLLVFPGRYLFSWGNRVKQQGLSVVNLVKIPLYWCISLRVVAVRPALSSALPFLVKWALSLGRGRSGSWRVFLFSGQRPPWDPHQLRCPVAALGQTARGEAASIGLMSLCVPSGNLELCNLLCPY